MRQAIIIRALLFVSRRNTVAGYEMDKIFMVARAVARTLIGGGGRGGGVYIHIFMFARQISFQIDQFEFDLKRNSLGRT